MVLRQVSKALYVTFGFRRPIDYVLRPILMLACIFSMNYGVKNQLTNMDRNELLYDSLLGALIGLPFVGLCYLVISHQAIQQRKFSSEAQTDELTNLPNRRALFSRAKDALRQKRNGFFLIIDADHFKRINDTFGHPTGDVCLQAVADRISSLLRKDDLIGRIGGEEFGVLLFDRTLEELQRLSGRLCFPIQAGIPGHSEPLRITVSAGATEIQPKDTIEALTTRADEALIAAKNNGRERMVLWRPVNKAA